MKITSEILNNIVSVSSFGQGKYNQNLEKTKEGPVIVMKKKYSLCFHSHGR